MVRVAAAAITLGLFPAPAWANSGIGYLMPSAPAMIFALVPVILLEAPVLAAVLRLSFFAGLKLSAAVNVRSTLLGIVIALVADFVLSTLSGGSAGPIPSRAGLLLSLVPMFLITWWIERRAVVRKYPQQPPTRAVLATLAANVLSYAALSAAIVLSPFFKYYDQLGYLDHVSIASHAADRWKERVETYWQMHKRFPERADDLGLQRLEGRRDVRSVTLEPAGRVVLELSFPREPELDRKRLIYEPRVADDTLKWKCRTPDMAPRYTPYECRDKGNEGK